MAPGSKRKQIKKRATPSSARGQVTSNKPPIRSKRSKPCPVDTDEVIFVREIRNNESTQVRIHQPSSYAQSIDFLDHANSRFTAPAMEAHAMGNTNEIGGAIATKQQRQHSNLSMQQPYRHIVHVCTPTASTNGQDRLVKQQNHSGKPPALRFLLTDEDRYYINDFFKQVTPAGQCPPNMQSLIDLMENMNDQEEAEIFLYRLEAEKKSCYPPELQSQICISQDPFMGDTSRLQGPTYDYDYNDYRFEDFDPTAEYLVDVRKCWELVLVPEFHVEDQNLAG